jgi:hypothetical protein
MVAAVLTLLLLSARHARAPESGVTKRRAREKISGS